MAVEGTRADERSGAPPHPARRRPAAGGRPWPRSSPLPARLTAPGPLRQGIALAALILVLAWALVVIAWWLLPDARTVALEIPAGTEARIAAGEAVEVIPDTLLLRRGDTLVVQNRDDATHRLGGEFLPPRTTTRLAVGAAFFERATLVCSFHPGGAIGVAPTARPGLAATWLPTAIIWVPTTGALLLALTIARRLQTG